MLSLWNEPQSIGKFREPRKDFCGSSFFFIRNSCLEKQFSYNYKTFGGSKLPVLAFYSIYQILIKELARYKNTSLKALSSHTTSDKTSNSAGDIEIFKDDLLFEAVEIKLDKAINLMVETDRTDSEIDNWADEYYRLDSELLSMRAKNCMSDDGEIQVTDEENALETKMENINNSILSKIVDGAEIDVSVQFTDGSVQSEKIRISYNNGNCGGEDNFPSITFRLV